MERLYRQWQYCWLARSFIGDLLLSWVAHPLFKAA